MLDLNRVIGFVFYSRSSVFFRDVKQVLLPLTAGFEPDDVAIVFDDFCQGSGPITAAVANSKRLESEEDFILTIKAITKEIGAAEVNSPKHVFIISDEFGDELKRTIVKLHRINATYDYPAIIKPIQVHPSKICEDSDVKLTVVAHVDDLQKEVKRELEANVV
jgi:hypothetical protein